MGYIPKDKILEITSANDVYDVISDYIELKKTGRNFKACCPFHQEKTPSFTVSQERQSWRCFGQCHEGGDVVKFIMKIENIDFPEALKFLADRAGIKIVFQEKKISNSNEVTTTDLFEVLTLTNNFFTRNLKNSEAHKYLLGRHISEDMIENFELGYAPSGWSNLINELRKYSPNVLEQAGLVIKKNDENRFYDRFRNRVIFSIMDVRNRVIGFGARALGDDNPKYLNSPNSPVYNKSKVLFGIDKAAKTIRETKSALIMEGYTDVIIAHQFGFTNAVATCGTALTSLHIMELRAANELLLVFDGDEAGLSAAERTIPILLEVEKDARIITLPEGLDPCDFLLKYGADAFKNLIKSAKDFITFKLDRLRKLHDKSTISGLKFCTNECIALIKQTKSPIVKSMLLRRCANFLDTSEKSILNMLSSKSRFKNKTSQSMGGIKQPASNYRERPFVDRVADNLIAIAIKCPDILPKIVENFADFPFSRESREILNQLYNSFKKNVPYTTLAYQLSHEAQDRISDIELYFRDLIWNDEDEDEKNDVNNRKIELTLQNCQFAKKKLNLYRKQKELNHC